MKEAVIEAEGLTRRLAGEVTVTLVEDATLAVHQGEFVAITGASGSGKSSLLYLLGLLDRPTSGQIWLHGDETSTLQEDTLAGLRLAEVGFVFQFHFLLPEFSALENVMLPMQRLGRLQQPEIGARDRAARPSRSRGRNGEASETAFGWAKPAGCHRPRARQRPIADPGR
jgi:lipoprotein-releasing system ATP-binding protein